MMGHLEPCLRLGILSGGRGDDCQRNADHASMGLFSRTSSFMGFQCTAFSKTGIYTVKRSLLSAIMLGGLMVSAQAADLSRRQSEGCHACHT